jgi:hypothetical protein
VQPCFPDQHDAFVVALQELVDALGKAFLALRDFQALAGQTVPTMTTENAYETFYGHLWRAYKGRFPPVMATLGPGVGFLFQTDSNFEKGATDLVAERPDLTDLVQQMRADRQQFQNDLDDYRQHVEHQRPVDERLLARFLRPDSPATMFNNVWQAVEEDVALYVQANLSPSMEIWEILEAERDSACPIRFKLGPKLPGS